MKVFNLESGSAKKSTTDSTLAHENTKLRALVEMSRSAVNGRAGDKTQMMEKKLQASREEMENVKKSLSEWKTLAQVCFHPYQETEQLLTFYSALIQSPRRKRPISFRSELRSPA